jgi:uncharacterized protein YuzE
MEAVMALASVDIEQYLSLAATVKQLPKRDFYLSYDVDADVLYINFFNPAKPADDTKMTDNDVLVRYDEHQQVIGLTILQASHR